MNRSIILSLCVSCLAFFVGCVEIKDELENMATPTISVNADAGFGPVLKTSMSYDDVAGYSSDWEETDVLGFYYLPEGSSEYAKAANRGTLTLGALSEGKRGSFLGSITKPEASTDYVFNAFYPSDAYSGLDSDHLMLTQFRFTVLSEQNPVSGSFDPEADVLVARPVKKTVSPIDESISLDFNFERVVSIMRISFPTISYDGISPDEKIMQVTVSKESAGGNVKNNIIAGRVQVDPSAETMEVTGFSTAAYSLHSITANYTSENAPTLADGDVYITLVPRTLSAGDKLIVKVTTDKHIITKESVIPEGKTLDFPANAVKHVKVAIDQNATVETLLESYYTKVTSLSQITSEGQYILVYDNGATGMVATSISDKKINATSVEYVEGKGYRVTDALESYAVRFEATGDGKYYINVAGKYVVYSSGTDLKNNVTSIDDNDNNNYKWNISVDDDGNLTILSAADDGRWLKYSTSGYFKAYGSGASYKNPRLYIHP